jgi:RNA polymerase-binding transcription factor DksA
MAKKVQKKAAPKVASKTKNKAKPAAKKASTNKKTSPKKAKPAKKVVAKKIVKPVKKVVATKTAPKAVKKAIAKPLASKAIAAKPAPAKKAIEIMKTPVVKATAKMEVKVEKPTEIYKETVTNRPSFNKIEKPKNPVGLKQDPRSRYSDKELVEFKELIHKKLEEATRDYELLKNTLSHKDDHGTDDTSPTFKLLEDGSDVLSKEETAHLAARQEKYIQNLKNALIRIENKTYGICRVTGKLIPKERLRSVPHATLSIDAKLEQNR